MTEEREETAVAEEKIRIPLSKPIPVYDKTVSEIVLRHPTAADIVAVGNPVEFDPLSEPVRIVHDAKKMTAMITRLSNVPSSSLERLDPRDWVAIAWAVSPFFLPATPRT